MNVMMLLEMASGAFPDRPAFTDGERGLTYTPTASFLRRHGCVLVPFKRSVLDHGTIDLYLLWRPNRGEAHARS